MLIRAKIVANANIMDFSGVIFSVFSIPPTTPKIRKKPKINLIIIFGFFLIFGVFITTDHTKNKKKTKNND